MLPLRNQGFQDDWAYIQSVRDSLASGHIIVSEWSSAALIFPVLWGTAFSKILGFSPKTLHISTQLIFYFGIIGFYFLLRRLKISNLKSVIFSIVLLSYPWVFHYSYSFLTDVPFMSLTILSLLSYTIGLQENKNRYLAAGSFIAVLAFLTRQLGLALPVSILAILLYMDAAARKLNIKRYFYSLIPFIGITAIYLYWLSLDSHLTTLQYQLSTIFFKETLPWFWPFNPTQVGRVYFLYLSSIQRILIYFHLSIGFLLPVFLIFKPNITSLKKLLQKLKWPTFAAAILYLSLLAFDFFEHYARRAFILEIPSLITRHNVLPLPDFNITWRLLVGASIFIWIPIIGFLAEESINAFAVKNKKLKLKRFFALLSLGLIYLIYYESAFIGNLFKNFAPQILKNDLLSRLIYVIGLVKDPNNYESISQSFVLIYAIALLIFLISYIASAFQLKLKQAKRPELGLIFITFFIIFGALVFYMYGYWHQYVISIIPFFIIATAIATEKLQVNKLMAVIILTFIVIFSTTSTKDRYEKAGIGWEIGENMVLNGTEPKLICSVDESWLPYWYYETSFKKYVAEKLDDDKYLMRPGQWGTWTYVKDIYKCVYSVSITNNLTQPNDNRVQKTGIVQTGLFTKARYVIYKY